MTPGHLRLLHLREQTEAMAETMASERGRFDALRQDTAAPRTVVAFNLFQTPTDIADRMAKMITPHLTPDSVVLEPSAGLGRLYNATRKAGFEGKIVLCEQSPECSRELYDLTAGDQNATLKQGDFLQMDPGQFDAVIMNPPFKMGRDVKHINHALTMLKTGGILVALCYNGTRQAKALQPMANTWQLLPPGSFKESGTNASVITLTINKQ